MARTPRSTRETQIVRDLSGAVILEQTLEHVW